MRPRASSTFGVSLWLSTASGASLRPTRVRSRDEQAVGEIRVNAVEIATRSESVVPCSYDHARQHRIAVGVVRPTGSRPMDGVERVAPTGDVQPRAAGSADTPPARDMVWIPGGTFRMGSDAHYAEERPVHDV